MACGINEAGIGRIKNVDHAAEAVKGAAGDIAVGIGGADSTAEGVVMGVTGGIDAIRVRCRRYL